MRVYAVSNALNTSCAVQKKCVTSSATNKADSFEKSLIPQINFGAYKIHIVDGGAHANVMEHFARAIVKNVDDVVDVILHKADTNPRYSGMKQMKSVKEKLTLLNEGNLAKSGDYVAIPCSAQVQLNQLSAFLGLEPKEIKPHNVKNYKAKILNYLTSIPGSEKNAMDPNGQGFDHVFGVIEQINALVKKGVKVYLPAGHPIESALKSTIGEAGKKDDLYKFIYTRGKEGAETVNKAISELKSVNAYRFNLLALSDAHVVNVRDLTGRENYVFAAYDNCVNDGARGVFNFYPVRNKDGKILGYSFTDKRTVQYPIEEYLANDEFANIAKFVGKRIRECCANGSYTHMMKNMIKFEEPHPSFPDKLYWVPEIYSPRRLKAEKLVEKGEWVDNSEQLFFDVNDHGEVIFKKCDCEGSGRPSVIPMWGSCFATLNAIKRDIASAVTRKRPAFSSTLGTQIQNQRLELEKMLSNGDKPAVFVEYSLNKLLKLIKPYADVPSTFDTNLWTHQHLYKVLMAQRKPAAAEGVLNKTINLQSQILLHEFRQAKEVKGFYDITFAHYWDLSTQEVERLSARVDAIAEDFSKIAHLCRTKGNDRAADVSLWAAARLRTKLQDPCEAIISRRASGSINIGDIYDAHKRD